MKDKEIKPGYGIGPVKFGLSRQEIEKILGEPDDFHTEEYEDGLSAEIWGYLDLGFELNFASDDDFLLTSIRFYNNKYRLGPDKLIGEERSIMLKSVKMNGFTDFKKDDEISDEWTQSFFSEKSNIIISVIDGLVDDISIFANYDDDGNPLWPE